MPPPTDLPEGSTTAPIPGGSKVPSTAERNNDPSLPGPSGDPSTAPSGEDRPPAEPEIEDPLPDPPFSDHDGDTGLSIWTPAEMALLKSNLPGYRATRSKKKAGFVAVNVVKPIKLLWNPRYSSANIKADRKIEKEWMKKKTQIFTWYSNHGKTERRLRIPGFNLYPTFDTVFFAENRKHIEEEARDLSGGKGESKAWIPHYAQAKKNVLARISQTDKDAYVATAAEYKISGVPREQQSANAARHGKCILRQMQHLKFDCMGMQELAFEWHYKEDGKASFSIYETSRMKFDWTNLNLPSFAEHSPAAFKVMQKAWPRVPRVPEPRLTVAGKEPVLTQQNMLRAYWTKHYGEKLQSKAGGTLVGAKHGIPYKSIVPHWEEFVDKKYLPVNIKFQDPSRYNTHQTHAIFKLWRRREADKIIPFRWNSLAGDQGCVVPADYADDAFEVLRDVTDDDLLHEHGFSKMGPNPLAIDSDEDADYSKPPPKAAWELDDEVMPNSSSDHDNDEAPAPVGIPNPITPTATPADTPPRRGKTQVATSKPQPRAKAVSKKKVQPEPETPGTPIATIVKPRPTHKCILLTPETTQATARTPTPEETEGRKLRSANKKPEDNEGKTKPKMKIKKG
ncbi:hypothetical protein GALMADRAFT_208972 [Galerina marginata CBS 339.88]|uniref:Uncharacterized protein n=1 Tax=Galerina marginata (strain CBS 339.88) TaxID=685588 RepID=A0A067TBF8_GALM3|nr:hypothetical protein GALMADRAFT_208972 [Galerina marginata CBS 339.88]